MNPVWQLFIEHVLGTKHNENRGRGVRQILYPQRIYSLEGEGDIQASDYKTNWTSAVTEAQLSAKSTEKAVNQGEKITESRKEEISLNLALKC